MREIIKNSKVEIEKLEVRSLEQETVENLRDRYELQENRAHFFRFELRLYIINSVIWSCLISGGQKGVMMVMGYASRVEKPQEGIKLA